MRRRAIFIFLCLTSTSSFARVATSSLFPAIRSINPAAISDRAFSGYSIQASKKDIETTFTPQENSYNNLEWSSTVSTEGIDFNSYAKTKALNFEFYASPKRGAKKVITKQGSLDANESESELDTLGLHILASLKIGKYLTIGAKRSKASTDFTDKNLYPNQNFIYTFTTEYDMSLDTAGYGLHLRLLNKKLHIGAGIEDITLDTTSLLTTSLDYYTTPENNSSTQTSSTEELSTKKTFFGIAYFSGNIKSHGIKLEFSRETMPSIIKGNQNLKDGEASI